MPHLSSTIARRIVSRASRCLSTTACRPLASSASEAASRLIESFSDTVAVRKQLLDANQLQKLSLTLGRSSLHDVDISELPPPDGTPIPAGYHLVYFTPNGLENELGPDGTDRTFNAPAPYSRRMWAGGSLKWHDNNVLRVGDVAEERTKLKSAIAKKSKSGSEMVLVQVEKEVWGPRGLALVDYRSWIFRPEVDASAGVKAIERRMRAATRIHDVKTDGHSERHFCWSPVGLFRFSALTFNGHKIHYNEDWTGSVEDHPGIVVHGPLNLINILNYWTDIHGAGRGPKSVSYRAMSPLYAGDDYAIKTVAPEETKEKVVEIVAEKDGVICMKAEVS